MDLYVTQTIIIHKLSIGTANNSSVIQIGTAGAINALSNVYNTGGFKGPGPALGNPPQALPPSSLEAPILVPLTSR
ncbi:spore germination protein GerPB [Pullulanibacillus sp. KACC 23026]|uniref:spore germination protein GerPB n=1 Tax=Pullulanibacillus sp. KACC 23026 TaxID=3028315 RepID=UPI0023B049EB|nr:spore germination protein GerPB [Pullulanibacillus sp. KACC 23026]WEG12336.1 spore germination protein GerPB [Pullulanibacillus sp. KACC 23026]